MKPLITAFAPGRVNIIGGHTDYTGGLVLSMAIELGTTFEIESDRSSDQLVVTSADEPGVVELPVDGSAETRRTEEEPGWGRLLRAVLARRPDPGAPLPGGLARVTTTLPIGAGLSSSAAFEVAADLALGADAPALDDPEWVLAAAQRCQAAEQEATGVPCGLMDQITSLAGRLGHALLLDCTSFDMEHVPLPEDALFLVAHCGEPRRLAGSGYATRRSEAEAAAAIIGPLANASRGDVAAIGDPTLRRRARHVISENERVRATAEAFCVGDLAAAGELMNESHRSLATDYDVSTPALESLVEAMRAIPGVVGARITGAGFGGCAVALADRSASVCAVVSAVADTTAHTEPQLPAVLPYRHWVVTASGGAWRRSEQGR